MATPQRSSSNKPTTPNHYQALEEQAFTISEFTFTYVVRRNQQAFMQERHQTH